MAIVPWTATGPDWLKTASGIQNLRAQQGMEQTRQQQARILQDRAEQEARAAQLGDVEKGLALRGQILHGVASPQGLATARAQLSQLGISTTDLPEEVRSDAWKTFQRQGPEDISQAATAATIPAWLPEYFRPAKPAEIVGELPSGPMYDQTDVDAIRTAAERGFTLPQLATMARFEETQAAKDAELASRDRKYAAQRDYQERAARMAQDRAAKTISLAERKLGLEEQKVNQASTAVPKFTPAVDAAMKGLPTLRDEARTAVNGIKTIDQMTSLLDSGAGARTGLLKTWLGRLTGQQTEGMADAELFQLLAETMRGPLRADIVGPGPMTESEQRLLGQVTGGGTTGLTASRQLLAKYKKDAQAKVSYYHDQRNRLSQFDPSIPDVYAEFGAGGAPKPQAQQPAQAPQARPAPPAKLLKEGKVTTFEGKGSWTLRNGVVTEVK